MQVSGHEEGIAAEVQGVLPQFIIGPILNEPLGRKNDPPVRTVANGRKLARGGTQGGQCTDQSRSVIVVSYALKLDAGNPARENRCQKCDECSGVGQVIEKDVRPIASSDTIAA